MSKARFIRLASATSALALVVAANAAFAADPSLAPAAVAGAGAESAAVAFDDAGEITVTARRRAERAQDVPIALSVVGAETLEATGNFTLGQVQQLVPSLQMFGNNARNINVNIRGLGTNALTQDGLEGGVGFYIDNVYYGRVGQSQFDLVDLAQIEVLRGPQGTLFGKNTTAGAINISSRLPSFDPEFSGEVTLGNYGYHQLRGSVSAPIIDDKVAFRLSVADTHRDGFMYNVHNGRKAQDYDNFTVRGQLLIRATPDVDVRLIGDYSSQKSESVLTTLVGMFTKFDNGGTINNNFLDRAARAGYTPLPFDPFSRKGDQDSPYQANMESYGVSGQIDWDLGGASLTSITAYRWWDWYPENDGDGTGLSVNTVGRTHNHQRQFSQEVRLASSGSRKLDYVVGAYYFWQVIRGYGGYAFGSDAALWNLPNANQEVANAALDGFRADSLLKPETKSFALFGQTTWNISDSFKLTSGLRYTHEEKTGAFEQYHVAGRDLSFLSPANAAIAQAFRNQFYPEVSYTNGIKDDSLSGLLNLSYVVAPDVLLYGSYSHGSKSGGLTLGVVPADTPTTVRPEKVNAFELGLKSQLFDRRVTFNVAGFWTEVSDYQTAIVESIGNTSAFRRYLANIPKVRSRGFDADLVWNAARYVNFTAAVAYNDATYVEYTNAPQSPENNNIPGSQDLSGARLAGTSEFSYTLSGDVAQPVGSWGSRDVEIYGRADYAHRSSYYTAATNSRYSLVPGYGLLNGRIGVRTDDGLWDLSLWARNLTNKNYFHSLSGGNNGLITGITGDPRTIGVTLRTKL